METCGKLIGQFTYEFVIQIGHTPSAEKYQTLLKQCDQIKMCVPSMMNCHQPEQSQNFRGDLFFFTICGNLDMYLAQIPDCLTSFYSEVYTENTNCTKQYDFLTKDLVKKREAFTNGKECFLEITDRMCNETSIDNLNSNYEGFLDVITIKSEGKCGFHEQINVIQCTPLILKISEIRENMNETGKIGEANELCNQTISCLGIDECSETVTRKMKSVCLTLEMSQTKLFSCAKKAMESTNEECVENIKTAKAGRKVEKNSTETKDCARLLLKEACPNEDSMDLEQYVDVVDSAVFEFF